MAKDNETKNKFIELRGQGLSFDKIVKQLDVSKGSLLKWDKEFKQEISEIKFISIEAMIEQYKVGKSERIKNYGELLKKYRKELSTRDLEDVPSNKLLDMAVLVEDRLREEIKDIRHYSKETDIQGYDFDVKVPVNTWHVDD